MVFASGWGCDRESPEPVNVVAMIGGVDVASGTTSWSRADVSDHNDEYANARGFGLSVPLPDSGDASVCLYLEDPRTGSRIELGCREFGSSASA